MAAEITLEQKERKRLSDALYYQRNKERIKANVQRRYLLNPSPIRDYAKKYYDINRHKVLARYYENPQANIAKSGEWKRNHREQHAAHSRKYHKSHPGHNTSAHQKRRALKKKATINLRHIRAWMNDVKSQTKAKCYYCEKTFPIKQIHFDHIISLSKGGSHSVENLCVSCASCNLSKRAKPVSAWIRIGQQILSL